MNQPLLPSRRAEEFRARNREGVPEEILTEAAAIVERVRSGGEEALREYTTRFGDCMLGEPLYLTPSVLTTHAAASSESLIGSERSPSCNSPRSLRWTPPYPAAGPAIVSIRSKAQVATLPAAVIPYPPRC